ncbi:MAG: HEAT repeat protein [Gammaproteobacteria bacterium]|jgi:HEAT repeat protein
MAALSSILFKRTVNQFLKCDDIDNAKSEALLEKIKKSAHNNLGKFLEIIATAKNPHREILESLCSESIQGISEKFFLESLAHDNTEIRYSARDILAQSKVLNPAKLFRLLHEPATSCSEVIDLLDSQKSSLKPEELIINALKMDSSESVRLIKIAHESEIPVDFSRLEIHPEKINNAAIKIELLGYLCNVQQTEVAALILLFLSDPNKRVVVEALKSLSKLTVRFDVSPVLLLIDKMSDVEQDIALEVIISQINPVILSKLSSCFNGKSTKLHMALASIVAEYANKNSFETFLLRLEGEEDWTRNLTINLLLNLKNKNLSQVSKELSSNGSEFVRNSAQNIGGFQIDSIDLVKIGEFALSEDWQVRLRAIQTLGKSSSRSSVIILQKVISVWPEATVAVLAAVRELGYSKGLEIAFDCLDRAETVFQRAAIETIASITSEKNLKSVCENLRWKIPKFSPEITALAEITIENLELQYATEKKNAVSDNLKELTPGSVWMERYRIQKEIGRGAMGVVMLVEDIMLEELLVLKILHPELTIAPETRERFKREFKYTRKVSHPGVIRVHDLFFLDNICALSMEYFESSGLDIWLRKEKVFSDRDGLEVLLQVSSAMAAAHKQGVIHRDLKPSNILSNETGLVKVIDFGIAAFTSGQDFSLTKTGAIIGSPAYLAPERVDGKKADSRSDIYSLGIIAYCMFGGDLPYHGKPMDILVQHRQGNAPLIHQINKNVNPGVSNLVAEMMAVNPNDRPQSMLAVLDEIEGLLKIL